MAAQLKVSKMGRAPARGAKAGGGGAGGGAGGGDGLGPHAVDQRRVVATCASLVGGGDDLFATADGNDVAHGYVGRDGLFLRGDEVTRRQLAHAHRRRYPLSHLVGWWWRPVTVEREIFKLVDGRMVRETVAVVVRSEVAGGVSFHTAAEELDSATRRLEAWGVRGASDWRQSSESVQRDAALMRMGDTKFREKLAGRTGGDVSVRVRGADGRRTREASPENLSDVAVLNAAGEVVAWKV